MKQPSHKSPLANVSPGRSTTHPHQSSASSAVKASDRHSKVLPTPGAHDQSGKGPKREGSSRSSSPKRRKVSHSRKPSDEPIDAQKEDDQQITPEGAQRRGKSEQSSGRASFTQLGDAAQNIDFDVEAFLIALLNGSASSRGQSATDSVRTFVRRA